MQVFGLGNYNISQLFGKYLELFGKLYQVSTSTSNRIPSVRQTWATLPNTCYTKSIYRNHIRVADENAQNK